MDRGVTAFVEANSDKLLDIIEVCIKTLRKTRFASSCDPSIPKGKRRKSVLSRRLLKKR